MITEMSYEMSYTIQMNGHFFSDLYSADYKCLVTYFVGGLLRLGCFQLARYIFSFTKMIHLSFAHLSRITSTQECACIILI